MPRSSQPTAPSGLHSWTITMIGLLVVIIFALGLRLQVPYHDRSIGEIDVYYWGIRTEQLEAHGLSSAGQLWVFPAFMAGVHRLVGGSMYNIFLWTGAVFSAIVPTIFIFLLTWEIARSKTAALLGALFYAVTPVVFYRGVFTVSETLAYAFIPAILLLSVRLWRRPHWSTYALLLASLWLFWHEHDSAKLVFLPAAVGIGKYFWTVWRTRLGLAIIGLSAIGAALVALTSPGLVDSIRFFLLPTNLNNPAFGQYPITPWSDYTSSFPQMLSAYVLLGLAAFFFFHWRRIGMAIIPLLLALPILYYQQIQPRLTGTTIVPFRLTPYLIFVIIPLAAIGFSSVARLFSSRLNFGRSVLAMSLVPIFLIQAGPTSFPLSFVTNIPEQASLARLPIRPTDYVVTQQGLLGMAAMATHTSEVNYYADTSGTVLTATSSQAAHQNIVALNTPNHFVTGVLISKWKLRNYDPYYGWWDSQVIPKTNVAAFRTGDFQIRFEDQNIVLFDVLYPQR